MLKSFVIENAYFWISHSSSHSFGSSHVILMTKLITFYTRLSESPKLQKQHNF